MGGETLAIPETLEALVVPTSTLTPYPRNPRRGSLDAIRASLIAHGQYRPIVVNRRTGQVLAGNHTLTAAIELGWPDIAVTYVDVDEDEAARLVLVDNRTNDIAGYADDMLASLLADLPTLEGTGYTSADLDLLLAQVAAQGTDDVPVEPERIEVPTRPKSRSGDLYLLGEHRLLCGDARKPEDVARLMDGEQINVAVTSPPYAEQREYDEASEFRPIPPTEYVDWFAPVALNVATHLADDGSWFVNIKPAARELDTDLYVLDLVLAHVREWGWHFATEFCWERTGVPKRAIRRFKNQFEPVYQFVRGDWKFRPNAVRHLTDSAIVPLGDGVGNTDWSLAHGSGDFSFKPGRVRATKNGQRGNMARAQGGSSYAAGEAQTAGFAYPGNRLPTFTGSHEATGHPAAFPVGLPQFFVKAYSDEGDVIYDPFAGSGSTLLAADAEGRRGRGMELSPAYCDVIVDRWERTSGGKAVRQR